MQIPLKSNRPLADKPLNYLGGTMAKLDAQAQAIVDATEEAVASSRARLARSLAWLARLRGLDYEDRAAALTEWVAAEEAIADE